MDKRILKARKALLRRLEAIEADRMSLNQQEEDAFKQYVDIVEDESPPIDPPFIKRLGRFLSKGFSKPRGGHESWIYTVDRD